MFDKAVQQFLKCGDLHEGFARVRCPACPPSGPKPGRQGSLFAEEGNPDSRRTHEVDPDFLEFLRRENIDEPEPVWEP